MRVLAAGQKQVPGRVHERRGGLDDRVGLRERGAHDGELGLALPRLELHDRARHRDLQPLLQQLFGPITGHRRDVEQPRDRTAPLESDRNPAVRVNELPFKAPDDPGDDYAR